MRAVKLFLALAVTILVTASIISAQDASADADTQEAPPATYDAYTVLPGDSLIRIAQRFNTTVDELLTANGISADQQFAGWTDPPGSNRSKRLCRGIRRQTGRYHV